MNQTFTALVKQSTDWWIGWIEEIPGVNCQERTRDELLASLRSALQEALELNREDALRAAGGLFEETSIAV
jgi:predicted RNase H-like HicB family nuclease